MTLISILISLLIHRLLPEKYDLNVLDIVARCFDSVLSWLQQWRLPGLLFALIVVLSPATLVFLVNLALDGFWLGSLSFIWSTVVLILCLNPLTLENDSRHYIDAVDNQDRSNAMLYAQRIDNGCEHDYDNESAYHLAVIRALFYRTNISIVGVLFWFIVLGPFGAVIYQMVLKLCRYDSAEIITDELKTRLSDLFGLLSFLPARILQIAYAFAGRFDGALDQMLAFKKQGEKSIADSNNAILSNAGIRALGVDDIDKLTAGDVQEARQLIIRSMMICLALVGILALTGAV